MSTVTDEWIVDPRRVAIPLGARSIAALAVTSVLGLAMFAWPLLLRTPPDASMHTPDAPFVFMALLPAIIVVVLAQLTDGGMDSKALAMLGVLAAINAALRPLGAGLYGVETVFFLLVLAGRVFGAGFGFALGTTSLFASALLTGGVGPWLPFQMLAAGWVGLFAGLLPGRGVRGRGEIALLVGYSILASYGYGLIMNLTGWPFLAGIELPGTTSPIAFVPGDPLLDNLRRFLVYTFFSSTAGWDTGRAITTSIAVVALGPAVLATLRRAASRAQFIERR